MSVLETFRVSSFPPPVCWLFLLQKWIVRASSPPTFTKCGYVSLKIVAVILCAVPFVSARPEVPASANGNEIAPEPKGAVDFNYRAHEAEKWKRLFVACGENMQSPIDIDTTSCHRVHRPHLFWWNYHLKPKTMTLTNNGHTVMITGDWASRNVTPYFWQSNGGLSDEENFVLEQVHFHWGQDGESGSEHLVNNQGFAMELHAVHYSRKAPTFTDALTLDHGIRVVAIFFMMSDIRNPALDPIIRALPKVHTPGITEMEPFELGQLIPRFSKSFAMYNGSLTTPPCTEAVTWVVKLSPSTISPEQVEEFRKVLDHTSEPMSYNVRPTQPINGRTVLHVT